MGAAPKPLVVVVGPTASGKSSLAIDLATRFGGEIVNCDSLQVYKGFDIGTAKVSVAGRRGIPHHLLDVAEPHQVFTAGDFVGAALTALAGISGRRRLPIIAGGAGFYLRSLLEGLAPAPARDDNLRRRLAAMETRQPGRLHRFLSRIDPQRAASVHPNDTQKTLRAIEICCLARRPASALKLQRQGLEGYAPLKIGLAPPRAALWERAARRAAAMFDQGLLDEVRSLLANGVSRSAKPFESLGYKESLAVLETRMSLEEARERTIIETRQYIKRQMTWFRREADIHWIAGFGDEKSVWEAAADLVTAKGYAR